MQCRGAAMTSRALVDAIRTSAPDVEPAATSHAPTEVTDDPVACPKCTATMRTIAFGPIELDRCPVDTMLWFDDWEHVRVLAAARDPGQRAEIAQLLHDLSGG